MTVHRNQVEPSVIVDIVESISPPDDVKRSPRDARDIRNIRKTEIAIVTKQFKVLLAEMSDGDGELSGVEIIAERDTHVGESLAVFIESHTGLVSHIGKVA